MISASTPHYATFKNTGQSDQIYFNSRPVIAWDDDGNALVADAKTGFLRRANYYSNFVGVDPVNNSFIGIIPGGGWTMAFGKDGDDEQWTQPVIAWVLRADGEVAVATLDGEHLRRSQ